MQEQSSTSTGPTCDDTTMCGHSRQHTHTHTHRISESISSAAVFPAKTSATLETKKGCLVTEADCGKNSPASLARYDHATSSWRTSQRCFLGGWEQFSETFPRSGMTRNGIAFQLPQLVHLSSGIGCGLLPTLVAGDSRGGRNGTAKGRSLSDGMTLTDWLWVNVGRGTLDPGSAEQIMGFPAGWTALDASETPSSRKSSKSSGGRSLQRKRG
jgi:hypothetical protein